MRSPLASPILSLLPRFVVRPTDSRSDVDCYRLKENERSEGGREEGTLRQSSAYVGFLARLEGATGGFPRRTHGGGMDARMDR